MISKRSLFVVLFASILSLQARALTFNADVPPALQTQMLGDLQMVQAIQGNGGGTPIFASMFSTPLVGQSLIQFFTSRIQNVGLNDCGGGAAAACVRPNINNTTMWLTPMFVNMQIPQVYRVSIVFHESRHTEVRNGYWSHAICPTPFRDSHGQDIRGIISHTLMQGLPACDVTPYGAYALQAELLKNIQFYCANCTDKLRMDAKLFGDDTVNRISDPRALQALSKDVQLAQ